MIPRTLAPHPKPGKKNPLKYTELCAVAWYALTAGTGSAFIHMANTY